MSVKQFYKNNANKIIASMSSVQHFVLDHQEELLTKEIIEINHGRQRNKYNIKKPHHLVLILNDRIRSQPEHLRAARQEKALLKEKNSN